METIWDKARQLRPSTMATVAERRLGDAQALCDTKRNERANGAAYLAGFAVEILLKASLVRQYPAVARKRPHEVLAEEREIWDLIWRQHDLEGLLLAMPQLQAGLELKGRSDGVDYLAQLKKICATWTIHARYSAATISMVEARRLVDRIRGLKELLK